MSFPTWTRNGNMGPSGGLQGCSSAFMNHDGLKHTSVNLQELGFGRNHTSALLANGGRNDLASHSPTSHGIWASSSPADSDHDSWLRARRESSGSSADSGISRSISGHGSFTDDHHTLAVALDKQGIHPYGKISRPVEPVDLFAGLKITSYRSGSAESSGVATTTSISASFDTTKVMFPLNPVAKDFVPAPKSWAAIASLPNKGTKVVPGSGRPKGAPVLPLIAAKSFEAPALPTVSSPGPTWPARDGTLTAGIGANREQLDRSPKIASNSFIPAFVQAQRDRNISGASQAQSKPDSNGWTLMDGRSGPAAGSPSAKDSSMAEKEARSVKSPTRQMNQSPEALVQLFRQENTFNNSDLKSLCLEEARFFVMKPTSERDVFDAIIHSEWSSTAYGGELLDEVYNAHDAIGPVYLLFSVNGSGQFCGMARMTSPVKYKTNIWEAQRSNGKFTVKWIFIKDVPNALLRHINIDARGTKPVTNCRDATEIATLEALKVVKIIHSHEASTNVLETQVKENKDRRNVKRVGRR